MEHKYLPSFKRDAKKATEVIQANLAGAIANIKSAKALNEIANLKKLKGHKTAYRVRVNNFRLCFYYENDILILARFLPRKDVYRFFP